jgi:hypothetical protein
MDERFAHHKNNIELSYSHILGFLGLSDDYGNVSR